MADSARGAMLGKALQKSAKLTSTPIEVLISRKSHDRGRAEVIRQLQQQGLLSPSQVLVYATPNTNRAALWIGPSAPVSLSDRDIHQWLEDLEADLHQTHPDRALTLAVMSLAIALNSTESHQR